MSNELIRRYDVLGKAQWIGSPATWDDPWPEGEEAVTVEDIEAVPAVDAVEVVRCDKCGFRPKGNTYCIELERHTADGFYCAFGQRREE